VEADSKTTWEIKMFVSMMLHLLLFHSILKEAPLGFLFYFKFPLPLCTLQNPSTFVFNTLPSIYIRIAS